MLYLACTTINNLDLAHYGVSRICGLWYNVICNRNPDFFLKNSELSMCVCVCSNSRNDVPRVAQRYGTIAAHTRRRASVLVVFVVFCVHMHSFAGLIRRTQPPTFSVSLNVGGGVRPPL